MAEYIEREAMTTEKSTDLKIKAFNPHIVVSENIDHPHYSISYYDVEKKERFIGFGSYNLTFVAEWLKECFEKVEVDMTEVVRCKECKNYELMKSNNTHFCNKFGGYVTEKDFCSRCTPKGQRRDGDTE